MTSLEKIKENEYKCRMCGVVFEKAWSDEEAAQELKDNFGNPSIDDCDIVCDDCYKNFMGTTFN